MSARKDTLKKLRDRYRAEILECVNQVDAKLKSNKRSNPAMQQYKQSERLPKQLEQIAHALSGTKQSHPVHLATASAINQELYIYRLTSHQRQVSPKDPPPNQHGLPVQETPSRFLSTESRTIAKAMYLAEQSVTSSSNTTSSDQSSKSEISSASDLSSDTSSSSADSVAQPESTPLPLLIGNPSVIEQGINYEEETPEIQSDASLVTAPNQQSNPQRPIGCDTKADETDPPKQASSKVDSAQIITGVPLDCAEGVPSFRALIGRPAAEKTLFSSGSIPQTVAPVSVRTLPMNRTTFGPTISYTLPSLVYSQSATIQRPSVYVTRETRYVPAHVQAPNQSSTVYYRPQYGAPTTCFAGKPAVSFRTLNPSPLVYMNVKN